MNNLSNEQYSSICNVYHEQSVETLQYFCTVAKSAADEYIYIYIFRFKRRVKYPSKLKKLIVNADASNGTNLNGIDLDSVWT